MDDLVGYLRHIAKLPNLKGHSAGCREAAGEAAGEIERLTRERDEARSRALSDALGKCVCSYCANSIAELTYESLGLNEQQTLVGFSSKLAAEQEPLGDDFQRVLDENRAKLYEP